MTALFESLSLTIICNIFSLLISTYLLFSQIRKPILDSSFLHDEGSCCWEAQLAKGGLLGLLVCALISQYSLVPWCSPQL